MAELAHHNGIPEGELELAAPHGSELADAPEQPLAADRVSTPDQRPQRARRQLDDVAFAIKEEVVGEALSLEEQRDEARDFVEALVRELGFVAKVTGELAGEDTAQISVSGEDLGPLVGPGGTTLAALQEVTRAYVQRQTGGHSERILVDVAGYRARRAAALQRFAAQVADEVRATGRERVLEPMAAPDRKVVHDAVNAIDGVATRSQGEEPRRSVVIVPDPAHQE